MGKALIGLALAFAVGCAWRSPDDVARERRQKYNAAREAQETQLREQQAEEKRRWDERYRVQQEEEEHARRRAEAEREAKEVARAERARREQDERAISQLSEVMIGRLRLSELASVELCQLESERADLQSAIARERRVVSMAGVSADASALYEMTDALVENDERTKALRKRMREMKLKRHACRGVVGELAECRHNLECSARSNVLRRGWPHARAIIEPSTNDDRETALRSQLTAAQQAEAEARAAALLEQHGL